MDAQPFPVIVRFVGSRIGRRRDALPLKTRIGVAPDGEPDWDALCAEVHRHASNYLMSSDVDAALCEWNDPDTPPPSGRRIEGRVWVGGIRQVAVWTLHAQPRKGILR